MHKASSLQINLSENYYFIPLDDCLNVKDNRKKTSLRHLMIDLLIMEQCKLIIDHTDKELLQYFTELQGRGL